MIYPINNLPDHTLMHYQIQLSLYAFMLRKWNPEFEIEELKIIAGKRFFDKNLQDIFPERDFYFPYVRWQIY